MAEARKTVTIVFADIAGFTTLGETLDPETVRRVMERFFAEMRAALERHGGTVEKFIGDAVMAVFGIPTLHEDDALRAVRAAAEMRDALARLNDEFQRERGVRIAMRTGVNTGEVVVGDPAGGQPFATGDAVNIAARLQQAAAPGEILLGPRTFQLTRQALQAELTEPLKLKGKTPEVKAWRLLGVVEGAPAFSRRLDSPLVGRRHELARLRESFQRAVLYREPLLVTVLGAPGIGKSRLASEFAAAVGDRARILVGHCLPYGEGITFWPLAEIVRSLKETPDTARFVDARVEAAVGLSDFPASSEETFWAVRKLLEALAEERALVVVLEDAHWAEQTLLDLVEHAIAWGRDASMLVVCLARPEFVEDHPSWPGERIPLEPLSKAEAIDLMDNLVGREQVQQEIRARITQAAEGNPLFVEQMVAMLSEDGGKDGLQIPPTIQALLTARLDRLPDEERRILERASVIGKEFWRGALLELSPPETEVSIFLQGLCRREIIRPTRSSLRDEDAFQFRHVLIRDAAYGAIPKEIRAQLHERFGGWLEERTSDYEEIIGHHLEQAYWCRAQLGPTDLHARTLADRAADYLLGASRRASLRGDHWAAASLLDRAIGLLPEGDRRRHEGLLALGEALFELGAYERADNVLTEAADRAGAAGDAVLEWNAILERSEVRTLTDPEGQTDEAHRNMERAVEVLGALGDEEGLSRAWRLEAAVQHIWSQNEASLAAAQRALDHARRAGDEGAEALSRAWVCGAVEDGAVPAEEAIRELDAHLEWARAGGHRSLEATLLGMLCNLHAMCGRFNEARSLGATRRAIIEDLGLGGHIPHLFWMEGTVEWVAGNLPESEERLRRAFDGFQDLNERSFLSTLAALLAEVLYLQERLDEAEELTLLSETLAASDDITSQVVWREVRAKLLAYRGAFAHAEPLAREAAARAATTDFLQLHAGATASLAEVLKLGGRTTEAEATLEQAVELYERKGYIALAENARARLAIELQPSSPAQ
jgi:class 3 adenylate cyclase/tetratricopeptide (TPR) repeat protein